MFGTDHHTVVWRGERLHVELVPAPRVDWLRWVTTALVLAGLLLTANSGVPEPTRPGLVVGMGGTGVASPEVEPPGPWAWDGEGCPVLRGWAAIRLHQERTGVWPEDLGPVERACVDLLARDALSDAGVDACMKGLLPTLVARGVHPIAEPDRAAWPAQFRRAPLDLVRWVGSRQCEDLIPRAEADVDESRETCGFQSSLSRPEPPLRMAGLGASAGALGLLLVALAAWHVWRVLTWGQPVVLDVSPGRWVVDGRVLDRVSSVQLRGDRLILTTAEGRIWSSRDLLPLRPDLVCDMRSATLPPGTVVQERIAREALASVRRPTAGRRS